MWYFKGISIGMICKVFKYEETWLRWPIFKLIREADFEELKFDLDGI